MRYIDLEKIETDKRLTKWIPRANKNLGELTKLDDRKSRNDYFKSHNIWRDLKELYIDVYGEKCWYSESDLTGSYSDVDHFRPKAVSLDADKNVILQDGYWWLAYDYKNYRLSCEKCNRSFGEGGKRDYFPLKPGTKAALLFKCNDDNVLLDPCNKDDVELIDCDETGAIYALSKEPYDVERVKISKKIYNWNLFNEARRKICSECDSALKIFEIAWENEIDAIMEEELEQIYRLTDKKTPYSSFAVRLISFRIAGKKYEDEIRPLLER